MKRLLIQNLLCHCINSRELDEFDEHLDNLLLEDGTDEKNDVTKGPKSRDKDYRSDKRGQWILTQRMRNYRSRTECRGDIQRLNLSFLTIYESLIPPNEEKEKQKQLMALLDKHVKKNGLKPDANIVKVEILLKLADILKSDHLENVQALTRARVPIVKLMDPTTGILCDICVNNLLAIINTKLLRDYSKIDPAMHEYVLMCIHFLQMRSPPILPCLQALGKHGIICVEDLIHEILTVGPMGLSLHYMRTEKNLKRGNDDDTQHPVEADGLEKDEAGMLLALFTIKLVCKKSRRKRKKKEENVTGQVPVQNATKLETKDTQGNDDFASGDVRNEVDFIDTPFTPLWRQDQAIYAPSSLEGSIHASSSQNGPVHASNSLFTPPTFLGYPFMPPSSKKGSNHAPLKAIHASKRLFTPPAFRVKPMTPQAPRRELFTPP
ncbi:hypothetical protein LXL04_037350 [Taraxacum kok-saghyz]